MPEMLPVGMPMFAPGKRLPHICRRLGSVVASLKPCGVRGSLPLRGNEGISRWAKSKAVFRKIESVRGFPLHSAWYLANTVVPPTYVYRPPGGVEASGRGARRVNLAGRTLSGVSYNSKHCDVARMPCLAHLNLRFRYLVVW